MMISILSITGCLFVGQSAHAAVTKYWTLTGDPPTFALRIKSIDFTTGRATVLRKISPASYYGDLEVLPNGQIVYTKRTTSSTGSPSKVGIFLTDAKGGSERLLADGYWCSGDPCPSSKTLEQGSVSPDGNLVSYRKGSYQKILHLRTGGIQIIPWSNINPVQFSPRGTFYYAVQYSANGRQTLLWKSQTGVSTNQIVLPKFSGINGYNLGVHISPDERYAIMGQSGTAYNSETGQQDVTGKVYLLDLVKKKIIDSFITNGQLTSGAVWMSSRKFVYEATNGLLNNDTTFSLYTVAIRVGKMTPSPVPNSQLDRPSQLLQKISDTRLLLTRLDESKSIDELISLDPVSGEFTTLYQAKNTPTYFFTPLGPRY